MQNSKIEWTDHTFNPWWGCIRVSPGCEHCYAETMAKRYGYRIWGPSKTTERREMSANYWRQPYRWDAAASRAGKRARVFCASMADVFEDHPAVIPWRERLWDVIFETPNLDWLLLTKRPENIKAMLPSVWRREVPRNIWLGTSVESQEYTWKRIPDLLSIRASVHFLSCEPLLGELDISDYLECQVDIHGQIVPCSCQLIDWVIVGGESGPGARPMHPDWVRGIQNQCERAGAAFFFKQWGEYLPFSQEQERMRGSVVFSSVMQPTYHGTRVGKHAAGRTLDGRTWDELPGLAPAGAGEGE